MSYLTNHWFITPQVFPLFILPWLEKDFYPQQKPWISLSGMHELNMYHFFFVAAVSKTVLRQTTTYITAILTVEVIYQQGPSPGERNTPKPL